VPGIYLLPELVVWKRIYASSPSSNRIDECRYTCRMILDELEPANQVGCEWTIADWSFRLDSLCTMVSSSSTYYCIFDIHSSFKIIFSESESEVRD
jgi:hypothetical protein